MISLTILEAVALAVFSTTFVMGFARGMGARVW